MTLQQIKDKGFQKIFDEGLKEAKKEAFWVKNNEDIDLKKPISCLFKWGATDLKHEFWLHVEFGRFKEALALKPEMMDEINEILNK